MPAIVPCMVLLIGIYSAIPVPLWELGWQHVDARIRSWSLSFALCSNVVLIFVLVPTLGALGAAIATLVGNVVSGGMNILFYCRIRRVHPSSFLALGRRDLEMLLASARSLTSRN